MRKIGVISDTHGFLDEAIFRHFEEVDEIWHAGDIGQPKLLRELSAFKPVRAVWGNIDGPELRAQLPESLHFNLESLKVWMIHIAGSPKKYAKGITEVLRLKKPDILVCGHSHMCRIVSDPKHHTLYLNPGAAGRAGFHTVRTLVRFQVDQQKISQLQVIELGKRGR